MIKLQTKEHLVYFMQSGMMRLSNYDLHFIQNLQYTLHQKHTITTNQLSLLDKLIEKYKRQFLKQKLSLDFVKSLNWATTNVIESSPEFTEAYISISNGHIFLKCPFNKKFIAELRSTDVNPFKWNPIEKYYIAEYSTLALKLLYKTVPKHYHKVNYCPIVEKLINSISQFLDATIWSPTLVSINNRLIIAATNNYLNDAIKEIDFNLEPITLAKLSEYGVSISNNLIMDDISKFANSRVYETDLKDLNTVIDWLYELKCDCIFFVGLANSTIANPLYEKLNSLSIDHYKLSDSLFSKNAAVLSKYRYIAGINFSTGTKGGWPFDNVNKTSIRKIIKVHNRQPINIK